MDDSKRIERYGSPWLTPDEAAAYCRCGKDLIRGLIACGRLRACYGLGDDPASPCRKRLVNKADLDELLYGNEVEVSEASRALYGAA